LRPTARLVDQDPAHRARRSAEEVPAPVPARVGVPHQTQVGLVHEAGRLQRLARTLARHARARQRAQLVVDQRQELLGPARSASALLQLLEQARHHLARAPRIPRAVPHR